MKSVLMATAEFSPFVKSGGLGDVAGALPFALRREGVDARVIMPLYSFMPQNIVERMKFVKEAYVNLGWRRQYCGIYELDYNGLPMYFIDSKFYFGGDRLYYEIENDIERFAYFCMSVLAAMPHIDFAPDVIHCHDWHMSLIPVLFHAHFKKILFYSKIKNILTIHNLKYQGICNKYRLYDVIGLNDNYAVAPSLSWGYDIVNCFKAGLSVADKITTVSRTYAEEIRNPYYGEGLDWLLRWRGHDLVGIVNGIDTTAYDPSNDKAIAKNFGISDASAGKRACKVALQRELGLDIDPDRPLIAFISRLVAQKGLDLITRLFDEIIGGIGVSGDASAVADASDSSDIGGGLKSRVRPQFVMLGTGDFGYEQFFLNRQGQFPGTVAARVMFDESLAHRIYAASDFFLMPSIFEPCGISQMLAMRYGSLPIVRETGGLTDTVSSYNEETGEGNGYSFSNINAHDMLNTVRRALGFYAYAPNVHNNLVAAAMKCDYSWSASAKRYRELYENI